GRAIDVNPLQNPYISRSGQVLPPGGAAHVDRARFGVGRISAGSAPVNGFEFLGWEWGGRWTSPRDYQHFSANGR
ncbi:MAG: M15 family metallopeptidase, partial [Acidimicrobiia bacterium]|nr:M15 family metallopeptidase [Acidimicrobiia bacterium]